MIGSVYSDEGTPYPLVAGDTGLQQIWVDYIEAHEEQLPGRMFNDVLWGGYLAYRLHPRQQVFVHGFNDHLGRAHMELFLRIERAAPGWEGSLATKEVGWVLHRPGSRLSRALEATGRWQERYRDEVAVLYVRDPSNTGATP